MGYPTDRISLQHIDNLKKENFSIKLRVHFLEEQLARLAPDQMEAVLKQNINHKIEVQERGMEMKKLKKLVLDLEKELERLQRGDGGSSRRERDLEEKLEERARELRELRRRVSSAGTEHDDEMVRETMARNEELEEELDNAKGLLEENMEEIERLREMVESRDVQGDQGSNHVKQRLDELESENEELRTKIEENTDHLAQKED